MNQSSDYLQFGQADLWASLLAELINAELAVERRSAGLN